MIAFLPHIYDTNAKDRNAAIQMLEEVAKKHRHSPFAWFWTQSGDQLDVQKQFDIYAAPQIVTFAPTKKMGSVMLSPWGEKNISTFLTNLMAGKERVFKIEQGLTFKKADKWDGKDQKPPTYEDEL